MREFAVKELPYDLPNRGIVAFGNRVRALKKDLPGSETTGLSPGRAEIHACMTWMTASTKASCWRSWKPWYDYGNARWVCVFLLGHAVTTGSFWVLVSPCSRWAGLSFSTREAEVEPRKVYIEVVVANRCFGSYLQCGSDWPYGYTRFRNKATESNSSGFLANMVSCYRKRLR